MGVNPLSGAADSLTCDDPWFQVDTTDTALHETVCAAASEARSSLDICELSLKRPVTVETSKGPIHENSQCLASFDCDRGVIQIVNPSALRDHLQPNGPYALLPDDVAFRSLMTHELAHAIVYQNSSERTVAPVDHEYIANALELAALAPEHRNLLIGSSKVEPPVSAAVIDMFIYSLAPRKFAAAAFLYFDEHGCETVTGILNGSTSFWTPR